MYEPKVNLIINLQGRNMISEEESLRKVRRPLLNKYGKNVVDKNGNQIWHTTKEYDPEKTNKSQIILEDKNGNIETLNIFTRKQETIQKVITVNDVAYADFISNNVPRDYKVPNRDTAWAKMSKVERLEWHLNKLAESYGGTVASYKILDD